jgi:hypothetical protein
MPEKVVNSSYALTPQDIQDAILSGAGYNPDMDINGNGVVDVADVVAALSRKYPSFARGGDAFSG